MGTQTETDNIKASRKEHDCSWCGEKIVVGQPYSRWRWFDGGDTSVVKAHPECLDALEELSFELGEPIEFMPSDNRRGCNCFFERDCDRCNEINTKSAA